MTMHVTTPETLPQINFQSQPVVTTKQLAELYGTDKTNITSNFSNNPARFDSGKHYFLVKGQELKELKNSVKNIDQDVIPAKTPSLTLWTERGAARHAKMLDTDQAWDVFEKLEECYFQNRHIQIPATYSEALYLAAQQAEEIEQLKLEAQSNQPKIEFATQIQKSITSIKVNDYVKALSSEYSLTIGRNNFFAWMRHEKILMKDNRPYQRYIDNGWLEVRESTYQNKSGPVPCFTPLVTGKGQVSLYNKFINSESARYYLHRKAA